MNARRVAVALLGVLAVAGTATACRIGTASGASPVNVQIVVDTGPGGGSDLFARQVVKIGESGKLIDENWPVISKPQGGGLGAMAFVASMGNKNNIVAAFTSKWVVGGMAADDPPAQLSDLTPIAELAEEQQMIAVPAKSKYHTFTDFIKDARAHPGELVQVGGANTSVDNLVALKYEKDTHTKWKYLSFADGGPRITALLRGDAQMMIGAQSDFSEQVAAHQLRIIGVLGDHRAPAFPDVKTLTEQGLSSEGLPDQLQFRGIAGPPGMSKQAVDYYVGILRKLVRSPDWQKYMDGEGTVTRFVTGDELKRQISTFTETMKPLVSLLPQGGK